MQAERKCSHSDYIRCPVLTFGGSYPGFLSAMMRIRYPAVVDFAYAASAPINFYAQHVDEYAYYKVGYDGLVGEQYGGPFLERVGGTKHYPAKLI